MSRRMLPENVRDSALAAALEKKLLPVQPVAFDYWGELQRLRQVVSAQTGEMKVLFPEFTPHDEAQHLARLFSIADKLLERARYLKMNAAELFLLACGLYAHDWGMAVGREELTYLRQGAPEELITSAFNPLPDEAQRLRRFTGERGIRFHHPATKFPELSDDDLRLYIRRTHAWRSGARVRSFFSAAGSFVPQALDQVCQGHWLDFSDLDDERSFPSNLGVLGQVVNLRAIALYVRLSDLFDISDDRTPYALWRFVAPIGDVSQMEWKKHRSLSPVTFPIYADGRAVRFDGSTADPAVWAELEDLHHYCEDQIKGSLDLLARHPDERHQLDLRKLEWAVKAEGFRPVNIRFEFHRQRMFEILADEIYQGDSHVFLRELLQNSIDAIRFRRELVQQRALSGGGRKDVGLGFDDAIYFEVQHNPTGDSVVRCQDFGVGMDEYIIRNYLAVAGMSYYQSDEFKHLGLAMDPISRFGIGILSCFMVADRIEILTSREPQTSGKFDPLHIDVPAADRQFRVYSAPADTKIGTIVTVYVRQQKLRADLSSKLSQSKSIRAPRLRVTDYLSEVAGFVEFPIVVDEDGHRTVILNPSRPISDADPFRLEQYPLRVHQLSADYPWRSVFVPQDVEVAQRYLRREIVDFRRDLNLPGYEGTLTYLRPTFEEAQIGRESGGPLDCQSIAISTSEGNSIVLRQKNIYGYRWMAKTGMSPSSRVAAAFSVYKDGLLVSDAAPPTREPRFQRIGLQWPLPVLRVNLPKQVAGAPDVSRRSLLGTAGSWDDAIWRAAADHLKRREIAEALTRDVPARLARLGKLAYYFNLAEEELVQLVPNSSWPIPTLFAEQGVKLADNQLRSGETIRFIPDSLCDEVQEVIGWGYDSRKRGDNRFLSFWRGETSIAIPSSVSHDDVAKFWIELTEWHVKNSLVPLRIRFLKPPYPGLRPMPQREFEWLDPSTINETEVWEQAMQDPIRLDKRSLRALSNDARQYELRHIILAAPFVAPFETFFAGGDEVFNISHSTTIALIQCIAAVRWHQIKKTRDAADIGKAEDHLKQIAEQLATPDVQPLLDQLWSFVRLRGFLDMRATPPPLQAEDYIPSAVTAGLMRKALTPFTVEEQANFPKVTSRYLRPFGEPLTDVTPEEAPEEIVRLVS